MQETKERIRMFMGNHFKSQELKDEDDVFAKGFVDSLFAMQLVAFVEKEFGIKIANEDLDLQNFRSVNALADLVQRKSAPAGGV